MITVKEFYKTWEETEKLLLEMTVSPSLAQAILAEEDLKALYEMKKTLEKINPDPNIKIRGINTDIFGRITFENMQKYANEHHKSSSEKDMILEGATMSEARQKDLEFYTSKGYLPDNSKRHK